MMCNNSSSNQLFCLKSKGLEVYCCRDRSHLMHSETMMKQNDEDVMVLMIVLFLFLMITLAAVTQLKPHEIERFCNENTGLVSVHLILTCLLVGIVLLFVLKYWGDGHNCYFGVIVTPHS